MSNQSPNRLPQIITSSFIVGKNDINNHDALSICKILETITNLKDEAIVQILGSLDFSRIILEHFYLDFIDQATLNDLVTFQSYTNAATDDLMEIAIKASKKKGKWNVPIVNGSFVFAVKSGVEVAYPIS